MTTLNLRAFAKVNLFLCVLNRRPDGFHDIQTLFERIDLADRINLIPRTDNKIKIICDSPLVPSDNNNLCYKAASLLRNRSGLKRGVDIYIEKNIPVAAGLGGGSSDAAAVLMGLNRMWHLKIAPKDLAGYAARLGSDVAFFVHNTPFAVGSGRGEIITPVNTPEGFKFWHLICVPPVHVSTRKIYRAWDGFSGLTVDKRDVRILIPKILKNPRNLGGLLYNGLEPVTADLYPQVKKVRGQLIKLGLKNVLMSGSGSSVFALTRTRQEALSAAQKIKAAHKNWRIFVSGTL